MKQETIAVVGLAVLVWGGMAVAGDMAPPPVPSATNAPVAEASVETPQAKCPVMGGAIDKKLYVDHDGKRIYVCCSGCLGKVREDPAKYIKMLEDQGVTLEKVPAKSAD